MQRCSFFIHGKALFGSFPTQESVHELEEHGVRHFIDLTGFRERKTVPYITKYQHIKYSIIDHQTPGDCKSFAQLILVICDIIRKLKRNEKIYVHCKGGHGRSGIVVASILCYYYNFSPEKALSLTSRYHSQRPEMREKWRQLGSPQSKHQKDFVLRFFKPLKYGKMLHTNHSIGFDNNSPHTVSISNLGKFPNAYFAFQAFREPDNKEYVKNLENGKEVVCEKQSSDWEQNKRKYMMMILEAKFREHSHLRNALTATGLRTLVKSSHDSYWGSGGNGQGHNIHGKILSILREKFLFEDMFSTKN